MTDDVLIDTFARELARLRRSPRTIRNRRQILTQWSRWLAERDQTMLGADRDDVLDFLAQYREPETVGTYRGALATFYTWCVDEDLIGREPTRRLPTVVRDKVDPNPIPNDLLRDVLASACPEDRKIIVLGRFAGLRAAEIAAAHRVYLRRGAGGPVVKLRGKGSRWRELPAHPRVVSVLAAETGYLFESPKYPGRPVLPETVGQRMSGLLPGDHTCHDLRAAFATDAYWANGKDLTLVQRWLGHKSPATTLRYVLIDHDWAAMDALSLGGDWAAAA